MNVPVLEKIEHIFDASVAGWSLSVIDQASFFVAICQDGKIIYINQAGCALLEGANPDDILQTDLIEYVHSDYKDFVSLGLDILAEENDFIPTKFVTCTQCELDVKILVREIIIDHETYFVVEANNITEIKRASEAVRDREHRLTSILNTVAEGILTFNEAGVIESINPAAENIFGLCSKNAIGHHILTLMPEDKKHGYGLFLERKIIQKTTPLLGCMWQITGQHQTNGPFPLELTLTKLRIGSETLFTAVFRDITERKLNEERIKHMAHHDSLTGLPNRHLFKDRLNHAITISKRYEKKLIVMFIDLDKFKPINDTLGHEAGDTVLREVSDRLTSLIRESDTVARIGGDEFVILLEELDYIETGATVAEKILERLRKPISVAGQDCQIGASIGMSCYPHDSIQSDEIMNFADIAMYAVKSQGRNDFKFYNREMGDPIKEKST